MSLAPFAAGRRSLIAAAFCLATLLSGCAATRPNPSWQVPTAPAIEPPQVVFYATDRVPEKLAAKCRPDETLTTQPMYGNADAADGRLLYGEFSVQLPPIASYSDLAPYHPRPQCLRAPSDPVFLTGPTQRDRPEFFAALRQALEASTRKQVLIFIHGYDFEFDEAVLWSAELKRFLETDGPVVVYDWASRGEVLAYREDEQAVERSAPRLEAFLRELRAQTGDARLDLLAHSLGGRLLLHALEPIAQQHSGPPLFGNLILAAPDVGSGPFVEQLARSSKLARRTTLYVSSLDRALVASQRLHQDYRAGRDLILVPGVDTVDVSQVDTSVTRHSYYIDNRSVLHDVHQLLRDDLPPARRFGLLELHAGDAVFWRIRP